MKAKDDMKTNLPAWSCYQEQGIAKSVLAYHPILGRVVQSQAIRRVFKDCSKLGIEYHDIDGHIQKLTRTLRHLIYRRHGLFHQ